MPGFADPGFAGEAAAVMAVMTLTAGLNAAWPELELLVANAYDSLVTCPRVRIRTSQLSC